MRIGICDDDEISLGMVTGALSKYLEKKNIKADVDVLSTGQELINNLKTINYDLLLLDIDLDQADGIEIAKKLYEERNEAEVIFVSGCENRVFDSLKVEPLGFVRKRYFIKDFSYYLDIFFDKHEQKSDIPRLLVNQGKDKIYIDPIDIVYIEGQLKKQIIFLTDKRKFSVFSSMKELEKMLVPIGFIRIHNGYLVNYKFIKKISGEEIVLKPDIVLPVARNRSKQVRESFFNLIRENKYLKI